MRASSAGSGDPTARQPTSASRTLWNYGLFFWGEDAVADGLSPYVDAAPLEEQKYFLATQQADEARYAVFEDFVDIAAGREDPKRLAVRGRLRPQGDLRWLWRSRRMLPG
jgi:hypothetical protein